MRKAIWRKAMVPLAAITALAACGGDKGETATTTDSDITETVMDNVDDLQGTIDDDMIAIDDIRTTAPQVGDGAAGSDAATDASADVSADGTPPSDAGADSAADDSAVEE